MIAIKRLPMTRSRGFTLIELLIVVAIIAVLAGIAIPMYQRYTFRARRADGQQLLQAIATAQERYYSTNNKYTDLATLGYASPVTSEHGFYIADIPASASTSGQAFAVEAVPQTSQSNDVCKTLTIYSSGKRTPDTSDPTLNSNGPCW